MYNDNRFVTDNAFNRFVNLDNSVWCIIDFLLKSESKYADYLWKILKYDTMDCLSQPSLTLEERKNLVYVGNGDAEDFNVFISPFIDDAQVKQCSHLHIYLDSVMPKNHILSVVSYRIECIAHNKIINILGDASRYNPLTNPVEIEDGVVKTPYKNRVDVMLKSVLADLNGSFIRGVGTLQFNSTITPQDNAKLSLFNGRSFLGFSATISTLLSGVSSNSECGV